MAGWESYELLDFGHGRKLERFGDHVLDRPSPPAMGDSPARAEIWRRATGRYERLTGEQGIWQPADALPEQWTLAGDHFQLLLKPTPFGHIGVFPEQIANWRWIAEQVCRAGVPMSVLNLFAYTGGSTLAAAAAGASVAHVDSARNVVAWARLNAERSALADAPIRWLVEDARRFVERELRRGRGYEGVILDPPSYGHGTDQRPWKLEDHLPPLLDNALRLLRDRGRFLLFSCHSPGWGVREVRSLLAERLRAEPGATLEVQPLQIRCGHERAMDAGVTARATWDRR